MTVTDSIRSVVDEGVAGLGVTVYDVEHHNGVLRVVLDRPGGIDTDTLATASRVLSRILDDSDPIPGSYSLEVSSPGLERALRTAAHWRGAVGERVKVKLVAGVGGDRRIEGVVGEVSDSHVVIETPAGGPVRVGLADVERARTQFEFGPVRGPRGTTSGGRPREETKS